MPSHMNEASAQLDDDLRLAIAMSLAPTQEACDVLCRDEQSLPEIDQNRFDPCSRPCSSSASSASTDASSASTEKFLSRQTSEEHPNFRVHVACAVVQMLDKSGAEGLPSLPLPHAPLALFERRDERGMRVVIPGRLFIGKYPGRTELRSLARHNVSSYICLDELSELLPKRPYRSAAVATSGPSLKILHCPAGLHDVRAAVATLVRELQAGRVVYLHAEEPRRLAATLVVFLCQAYGMELEQASAYLRRRIPSHASDLKASQTDATRELCHEPPAMDLAVDNSLPDWKAAGWFRRRATVCAADMTSDLARRISPETPRCNRFFSVF